MPFLARLVAAGAATALASVGLLQTGCAAAAEGADSPLPGVRLPVSAAATTSDGDVASSRNEVVVLRESANGPEVTTVRAKSAADAARLAASLDRLPGVTAGRNQIYRVPDSQPGASSGASTDGTAQGPSASPGAGLSLDAEPYGSDEWGMRLTGAEQAWSVTRGAGITVAVIDSGAEATHSDLVGRLLPQINVVGGSTGDGLGHGTHVAGVIAASLDGRGVVGLANRARVLPIRVLDDAGAGTTAWVTRGIIAAINRNVQVINLSLGGPDGDLVLAQAIANAAARGITVVAAAGNEGEGLNRPSYPAVYPGVIGVASLNESFDHSAFSNTGPYVDLVAPGEAIWSTYPGNTWTQMWGTSMATPFVAATAALVRAANPTLSSDQVASVLYSTAWDDRSGNGKDASFGYGLVRADAATTKAAAMPGGLRGSRIAVRVSAALTGFGNVLTINVNPDKSDIRSYAFKLQKRAANGSWKTLPTTYATQGSAETRSVALTRGVYRVFVPATPGFAAGVSSAVAITAPTLKVSATATASRGKLHVNVDPDKGKGYWRFQVAQLKANGTWVTKMKRYKTKGGGETRTINLKAGVYRVAVAGKYGLASALSAPVTLVR